MLTTRRWWIETIEWIAETGVCVPSIGACGLIESRLTREPPSGVGEMADQYDPPKRRNQPEAQ
jgi:hypothetical protein